MPACTTPELWPVWCAARRSSFSNTVIEAPGRRRASSRPIANPTIPPPTMPIVCSGTALLLHQRSGQGAASNTAHRPTRSGRATELSPERGEAHRNNREPLADHRSCSSAMPTSSIPTRAARLLYAGGMFVLVSALCGVLLAAVALAGGRGGACSRPRPPRRASTICRWPSTRRPSPSGRTVLDANGDVLTYFYEENRVYVELDEIAPIMQQAMIAIEDHRFYEHGPLDLHRHPAGADQQPGRPAGVTQGGSTITQQYVKMVQIEEAKKTGRRGRHRGRAGRQLRPQDPRAALRHLGREDADQGRDPRALPEHRLLRRRRVRHRGGRRALLRHHGGQAHPAAGGAAGRAGAEPDRAQPGGATIGGPGAARRRAQPDGRARTCHLRRRRRQGQAQPRSTGTR